MSSFFASIAATFVTIPILGYLITFIISKQVTKKHRQSVHLALDVSTILFICSVHYLIINIFGQSYLWVIFLFMLITAIIFILIHWKIKQEINIPLVFRGYWRVNFLLFFTAYVLLIIIGIVNSIAANV